MFTPPDPDFLPTTPLRPPAAPPQRRNPLRRFWQATRVLRWLAASLVVLGGSILLTRRLWPQAPLLIAVLVSMVLLIGLLLWGSHRHEHGAVSNLGASLLGGVLVAVTVFVVQANFEGQRQAALDREARRREAAVQAQQNLRFVIGTQRDLTGMDLTGQDLTRFYLRGKNLSEADLSDTTLAGADLAEANLSYTDLTGADLRGANLGGANLTGAVLTGAFLTGAELYTANLPNALLAGADLRGAYLTSANLTGAQLTGVDLTGADLIQANLKGADLKGAFTTGGTQWPQGFDWRAAGVNRG